METLDSNDKEQVNAVQYCIQAILNSLSGMKNKSESKPEKELIEKYKTEIDLILTFLIKNISNRLITGIARDSIIEILIRNVHYTALDWAMQLVDQGKSYLNLKVFDIYCL